MKEYIFQLDSVLHNKETGEAVFKPTVKGELIRCKDCKWLELRWCMNLGCIMKPDDFCSKGDRK